MKKKIRGFRVAVSLCLIVTVFTGLLAGCGGSKKNGGEGLSEYVYVPSYTSVPEEVTEMSIPYVSGDVVYFSANVPVHADGTPATQDELDQMNSGYEKYKEASATNVTVSAGGTVTEAVTTEPVTTEPVAPPTSDITYKTFLYSINKDGTNYQKLPDYVPKNPVDDKYSYSNLDKLVADAQGNIWVAESVSKTIFDLPEGFDATTQDPWQYYVSDERSSFIRKLSPTGAEISSIDLTQYVEKPDSQDKYAGSFYISSMLSDGAGNIYISDGNNTVYVIGSDGSFLFKVSVDNWISSFIRLRDGSVGVTTSIQNTAGDGSYSMLLKTIDATTKAWGKEYTLPSDIWNTSDGGEKYDFCYTNSSSLFGYDLTSGTEERILTWLNCDIDGDNVQFSTVEDNGNVFAIANNYSDTGESSFEMMTLVKTLRSDVKEKTTLIMATMWMDYNLKKQVLKFNKSNQNYRIEITDYSEYNTDTDYTAGATKLNTEMIAGNIPDLIDISNLPYKQYAAKGLLEDLYAFIDKDTELSRDAFIPGIIKAMETDGKLYQLATNFSVLSIVGAPSVVGEDMGWTMDDMEAIIKAHPDADSPFGQYMTRDNIIQTLCMLNMDQYMNWQTGECSFNSDSFKKLLTFAKSFPEKFEYTEDTEWIDPSTLIQDGRQIFELFSASDFQTYQYYKAMFGGAITFKGLPSENGSGNVAQIGGGRAMTSACKDKDAAWQFLRTLISDDYQESISWYFPITQKAFDKKLADAMKQEYTTDENGNKVPVSNGGMSMGDGQVVNFYAVTQEEADQIKALINSVSSTATYDQKLLNIIQEESAFFFSGEKTVDQVADIIQSRMTIYINEQR